MTKLKTLAIAALTLAFAGGAFAVEQTQTKAQSTQPAPLASVLDGQFRLSQTATCIYDGERYSQGARLCFGGVYQYCNNRGLWEPSNQTC